MPFLFKKENDVLIYKKLFSLQNFKIFGLLVDCYNSMKYAKFQHRSPDKITKYTALYLEKWSFCWRQQFAHVTQKPRVDVSKLHASCQNKLQSKKASRMVTQAYWNLARVKCGLPLVRNEVWSSVSSHLKLIYVTCTNQTLMLTIARVKMKHYFRISTFWVRTLH